MKLNLGCGNRYIENWVNVDFYDDSKCDIKHDLEVFPWPWEDNTISNIKIIHTLEHLGSDWKIFIKIIQEMYRVCEDDATIEVIVPSPWHWNYTADPSHVRPVIPETFTLFSKEYCQLYKEEGWSSTPFADIYDVDLRIYEVMFRPDIQWTIRINTGQILASDLLKYHNKYRNVLSEYRIYLAVVKSEESDKKHQHRKKENHIVLLEDLPSLEGKELVEHPSQHEKDVHLSI